MKIASLSKVAPTKIAVFLKITSLKSAVFLKITFSFFIPKISSF